MTRHDQHGQIENVTLHEIKRQSVIKLITNVTKSRD